MKRFLVAGGVAIGAAYLLTVGYLTHFDHVTAPKLPAGSPTAQDPVALAAFNVLREARCDYCHSRGEALPFYASLPIAHQLMQHDIEQGTRHFQVQPVLEALEAGKPVAEEPLARIEAVIRQNRMPPTIYLTMHWHAHLSAEQRQAVLAWVAQTRARNYAAPDVAPQFRSEPVQPLPETVAVDPTKAALGKALFFDTRLSDDNTVNCASCHSFNYGGTDGHVVSEGVHHKFGDVNAPSVFNSAFEVRQFWDGRAPDLAAQAAGPTLNPVEMGSHNWQQVIDKLQADPNYPAQFQAAYGSAGINSDRITDAIATYERTLVTPDSRFDLYLKGNTNAINAQEKHGYALFKADGCSGCHVGQTVGGQSFEVMGLEANYFAARGHVTPADVGEYKETRKPLDMNRFKVPDLRNVALTAPYFHDGSAKTLEQAVREMGKYQTDAPMPDQDVADIVAFLRTLTGRYQGKLLTDGAVPAH